jgi:hypothetical protein
MVRQNGRDPPSIVMTMAPELAAGRLYDAYGASLFRYAEMILASREGSEDVIQQVFVGRGSRGATRSF